MNVSADWDTVAGDNAFDGLDPAEGVRQAAVVTPADLKNRPSHQHILAPFGADLGRE